MQKVEVIGLSITDFQRMLRESLEEAIKRSKEEEKAPSHWEELTLEQAAGELGCCKRTLTRKMRELNIKGFRVGREITLQRKDLKKIRAASGRLEN